MRHKHPTKPRWNHLIFLCINFSSICAGHRAMFGGANAAVVTIGGAADYTKTFIALRGVGEYRVLIFYVCKTHSPRRTTECGWQRWKLSRYARSNRSIFPLFIQSFKIELNEITATHSNTRAVHARFTWCQWRCRCFIIRRINRGNRVARHFVNDAKLSVRKWWHGWRLSGAMFRHFNVLRSTTSWWYCQSERGLWRRRCLFSNHD